MLVLFAVILGGIVTGRLLQSRRLAFVSRLIVVIIWALLFLLGLEVGSDPAVVGGMATLRRTAFVIFVFSVAGSIGVFMAVVAAYPGQASECSRDGGAPGQIRHRQALFRVGNLGPEDAGAGVRIALPGLLRIYLPKRSRIRRRVARHALLNLRIQRCVVCHALLNLRIQRWVACHARPNLRSRHCFARCVSPQSSEPTACEPTPAPACPASDPEKPLSMWNALKGSLVIVAFFVAGCVAGLFALVPFDVAGARVSTYVLYALMFCVGVTLGHDETLAGRVRRLDPRLALLPVMTAVGTLAGAALATPLLPPLAVTDPLAVGSGFGYYSLSSIFIADFRGAEVWEPSLCYATSCARSSRCWPRRWSPVGADRWRPSRSAVRPPSTPRCPSSRRRPESPMPWFRFSTAARSISAFRFW